MSNNWRIHFNRIEGTLNIDVKSDFIVLYYLRGGNEVKFLLVKNMNGKQLDEIQDPSPRFKELENTCNIKNELDKEPIT